MTKNTIVRAISFDPSDLEKADQIVKEKRIQNVTNRSDIVRYALSKVFDEIFPKGA
ncbi:MAG: hypothetical protein PHH61_06460 [Candidatus Nanoarchaeia archaeon]|jgi:hypothetical protein|nr:hypothetical protein [Candidatus Nanoarchaeia archaeon]